MTSFGLKAKAIGVLVHDAHLARTRLNEDILDLCVKAGGNEYDVAIQYLVHRIATLSLGDIEHEWGLDRFAQNARKLAYMASNPELMTARIARAHEQRKWKRVGHFPT